MTTFNVEKTENQEFKAFIKENAPSLQDFRTSLGQKSTAGDSIVKIPRHLNNQKEDALMETAFRYLFHLNIARETRASLDVEQMRAIVGNRLVKKQHPLNLIYDFQYVAAKTQIKGYLQNEPYTVPYNQRALRIYGRCFLFAQLDLVAQTGVAPDKLTSDFYFLPKGTFTEEFEEMNELALTEFFPTVSPDDNVQFYPLFQGESNDYTHTAFLLNDTLVLVDTSGAALDKEDELLDIISLFFLQKINERYSSAPSHQSFTKIDFYRARFGEIVTLDLEAYFKETLDERVEVAYEFLK